MGRYSTIDIGLGIVLLWNVAMESSSGKMVYLAFIIIQINIVGFIHECAMRTCT